MKKWIREGLMLVLVGLAMLTPPAVRAAEPLAPVQVGQNIVRDEKFTIYLPQLAGLSDPAVAERLNGAINRDMDKGKAGFLQAWEEMQQAPLLPDNIKKSAHFWGTYAVKLNREGLFSLTVRQYFFTGGAHGMTVMNAYNMDVRNGQIYQLSDIFRPDADYRERLDGLIREDIQRNGKTMYRFNGIAEQQEFYLTEEGLVIFFQPYDIASWADGFVRFIIPYEKIRNILRTDLPLY